MVLLLATPPEACVVHFWAKEHYFYRNHLPLARLAYALGLEYYALPMQYAELQQHSAASGDRTDFFNQSSTVDVELVTTALGRCAFAYG